MKSVNLTILNRFPKLLKDLNIAKRPQMRLIKPKQKIKIDKKTGVISNIDVANDYLKKE